MLVAAIMTLLVPYNTLNVPDPVAVVVDAFGPQWSWLAKIIKIGAIIGLTSVVLVLMYAQTRIFYTMARDGLLPKVFARVHPRFQTPHINTILVGLITAFAAGFLSATLRELPERDRLRHGHLWAAAALTAPGDLAPPPTREHADRLAALDDDAWGRLRLGPGWTQAAQRAEEEVRTP